MTILAKGQLNLTLLNDGIGLSTMITYYYPSTSSVIQIDGNWSTTAPTWSEDIYIWTKSRVTYTDGSMKESEPICLTGGKGTNGKGIRSLITEYYLSTSKFIQTGGSWITTSPEWEIKKYLWMRIKITYTDETINYTSPICDSRFNDLEVKVDTVINKQASIDTTLADITLQASETMEKLYHYSAGAGNIFDDCAVSISKDNYIQTEISQSSMPFVINKDVLRGREVVISVDIYARKAVPKSLSGYMGAYFTVTYNDNTSKKYICAYYPGVRYLQQQLALGRTSMYQRIYSTHTIDDKAIKSVSNLTIVIACNGETLSVSNPKVEIGKEPVSGVLGNSERLRRAEMKITPEAITQAVSEKIGKDGEIKTAKFTLDKNGGHFSGGGIDVCNNDGKKVFYADTEGNLVLNNIKASGTIESSILIGGEITGSSLDTTKDISVGRNIKLLPKDEGQLKEITFGRGNLHYYKMENEYFTGIQTSYDASGTTAWVRTSCGVKNVIEPESIQAEAVMYACSHGGNKQTQLRVYGQGIKIEGGDVEILTNVHISGSLHVSGAKNRLVMLDDSNGILMGAVESTECVFEDIGHAKINDDGYCTIVLDELFIKTVNTKVLYYVFLTAMGKGELHVINKREHSFQVCGTSGLEFDWRITAKQKGYENVRMKEYKKEDY